MAILIPQDKMFIPYVAAAGQTTFAYTWPMYEDSDLTIYKITTAGVISTLTLTTDYTVTGVGTQPGGNVELVAGALVGEYIIVTGNLPESRSSNYTAAGDFTKESINESFNKVIQIAQQQRRDVDRSIHMNPADPAEVDGIAAIDMKLPLVADRANKYLYFDADGSVAVNAATGVAGPTSSVDKEVALFDGTTGQLIKRPSTEYMILPQGNNAQRGAPTNIVMRGNNDGTDDVEVYVNGGWASVLTGGTGAPINATYITQTPSGILTNEQAMSALADGLVKNTTATGVQSIAVEGTDYYGPGGTDIPVTDGGTGASTAGDARTNLGLVIGTDVQAYDATLQSMSALGTAADKYPYTTGVDTWAEGDISAFGRSLIDDAAAVNARTTLGLVIGTDVQAYNANMTAYDIGFIAGYTSTMNAEDLTVRTYGEMIATRPFSITGESGYLETQATGTTCIVDIEKNGTTVYTTKPLFAISTSTLTAGVLKTDGTEDFVAGDRLTFKVTQIGGTIAGGRMRFTVKGDV